MFFLIRKWLICFVYLFSENWADMSWLSRVWDADHFLHGTLHFFKWLKPLGMLFISGLHPLYINNQNWKPLKSQDLLLSDRNSSLILPLKLFSFLFEEIWDFVWKFEAIFLVV